MKPLSEITPDLIRANLDLKWFFETYLNGKVGKPTGGGWHMFDGLCPYHNDTSAGSVCVNLQTGRFKCFSCSQNEDFIQIYMDQKHVGYPQALHALGGVQCQK